MKLTLGDLKRILREAAEGGDIFDEKRNDSLDSQVDRYLMGYETEAKNAQNEAFDFRTLTRRFLVEAGEEEEAPAGDDADMGADALPAEETELTLEDIDIESFTNSVVRLIDNYDTLLEVRDTIVNRATNFLSKTYSKDVTDAFEQQLREDFDIEAGKSKEDVSDEQAPRPAADRAGPSMSDGGGGGGV